MIEILPAGIVLRSEERKSDRQGFMLNILPAGFVLRSEVRFKIGTNREFVTKKRKKETDL